MSFSITDKRDFKREVRKIIDDLSCDPCYQSGDDCCDDFRKHESDMVIHVTSSDRTRWDNKSDFSGSYNDLRDKPVIPDAANDGKTDLYYGDSLIGSWSANQANDNDITIPEPEVANDGRTTLLYGDTAIGSWSANQVNNNDITIPEPEIGNGRVSITLNGKAQGSFTVNQTEDIEITLSVAALTRSEVTAICNNIYGATNG